MCHLHRKERYCFIILSCIKKHVWMYTGSPCKMFFLLSVEIKEVKILRHGFLPATTVNISQSALIYRFAEMFPVCWMNDVKLFHTFGQYLFHTLERMLKPRPQALQLCQMWISYLWDWVDTWGGQCLEEGGTLRAWDSRCLSEQCFNVSVTNVAVLLINSQMSTLDFFFYPYL